MKRNGTKTIILVFILFTALLILTACSDSTKASSNETTVQPPSEATEPSQPSSVISPASPPSTEPELDVASSDPPPSSQSETPQSQPTEATANTELDPYQIYYDYFSNNFEIIEYITVHGNPWRLWGHRVQGELRATNQVHVQQIDGFDYPVLVLAEYTLAEDDVTLANDGLLHAYLIKDGEVTSEIDRTEFDAIFQLAGQSEGGGWAAQYGDDMLISVKPYGERLLFFGFDGDVRTDGSFDVLLDWLKEKSRPESAADADSAKYQGLTKEEWEEIQKLKAIYEELSAKKMNQALSNEEMNLMHNIGFTVCDDFVHMFWECNIDGQLIDYVGEDAFNDWWLTEQSVNDECTNIYSLADRFSMNLDELIAFIVDNDMTGTYPIEKVIARYSYMSRNGENYVGEANS